MSIPSRAGWTARLGANRFDRTSRRQCAPCWIAEIIEGWRDGGPCAILLVSWYTQAEGSAMVERSFRSQSKRGFGVVMTREDDVALTHLLRENVSPLEIIAVDFATQELKLLESLGDDRGVFDVYI